MTRRLPRVVHLLNLHAGERFRYEPGGELFTLAVDMGRDGRTPSRYFARPVEAGRPDALIEWQGCWVYPEREEDPES